jgi:exodeoxyribonuclease VII large subunit
LPRVFVLVLARAGNAVPDPAGAGREAALTLKFRDGPLDVVPASATPAAPRKGRAPSPPADRQPKLL